MRDYRFSTLAYVLLSGEHGAFRVRDHQERHTVWSNYADRTTLTTWEAVSDVLLDDDSQLQIGVPMTSWGDGYGSDLDRANWNALQADLPGVFSAHDRWGEHSLWVDAIVLHTDDIPDCVSEPDDADSLAASLASLRDDYPIWSEEALSAVEEELIAQAWDGYMADEILHIIVKSADETAAQSDSYELTADTVRDAFWCLYDDDDSLYPQAESATSILIPEWESVARELAARFVAGWRPGLPVFPCAGCGVELDGSRYSHGAECVQQALVLAV